MEPVKYYVILSLRDGELHPFKTSLFGEPDHRFTTEEQAETFIKEHFNDHQEVGSQPPYEDLDFVFMVVPAYFVAFKDGDRERIQKEAMTERDEKIKETISEVMSKIFNHGRD